MRSSATRTLALTTMLITMGALPAAADPEAPLLYDARSAAMGGTGAAFLDNASAVFLNPASLDQIDTLSATLVLTPAFLQVTAPFSGPGSERDSTFGLAPFFLGGAAVRVHDRIVIGAGTFITGGIGSKFEDVEEVGGADIDLSVGLAEANLPVVVRIVDGLAVSAALRLGYGFQASTQVLPPAGPGQPPAEMTQDMSGVGFPGFSFGVFAQPVDMLRLGLTYRTEMTIEFTGDTTIGGGPAQETTLDWTVPQAIRFGAAFSLLDDMLLIAADVKVQLYGATHETMVQDIGSGATALRVETQLDWETAITGHLGGEVALGAVDLRAGYVIGKGTTPDTTTGPFLPTPGILHGISGGAGFEVGIFDLGAAVTYQFVNHTQDDPTPNGGPGEYSFRAITSTLSASINL